MESTAKKLEISIDLGSDAVKVAYAYKSGSKIKYGKLAPRDIMGSFVVPAIAYYDEDNMTWIFGEKVYKNIDKSFATVIKIKALLSLLLKKKNKELSKRNMDHYYNRCDFPKFYFPNKKKLSENFAEAVSADMTFKADRTPRQVCEDFFAYLIDETVLPAVERLQAQTAMNFGEVEYSVVYPTKVGREYIEELGRIVSSACGKPLKNMLSSTKALGLYAYHREILKKGESLLIFDMGEQDISVAKFSLGNNDNLIIDGVDGHNEPMELGGNDIDYAVREFIEDTIGGRETVGAPHPGSEGYIAEKGLHSKQFLMLNEIKKAKTALSLDDKVYDEAFPDGVPMSIHRDVMVQTAITRENFLSCIGVESCDHIAKEIVDYIKSELDRRINRDVEKIVLSGGVIETYGLIEFIERQLRKAHLDVEIFTFDDYATKDDGFVILSHEDSMFAPAVGGAIVALMGYELKTAVALAYGTWLFGVVGGRKEKILEIFLERGRVLPKSGGEYFTTTYVKYNNWSSSVKNEEIFSTTLGERGDVIGEPGSEKRRRQEKNIDLKVVAGGANKGEILFYHIDGAQLRRVEIQGLLHFKEGVRIDGDGRATPFIANDLEKNGVYGELSFRYVGSRVVKRAYYKDIMLKFAGVDDFDVENSD